MVRKDQIFTNPASKQIPPFADDDIYKTLTKKQFKFIQEYMVDMDATNAFIRAGYSKNGAAQNACILLCKPNIRRIVDMEVAKVSPALEISPERTIKEVARIAYFQPKNLYDTEGKLISINKLDENTAACIKSIKETRTYPTNKDWDVRVITELTIWDKNSALDKLMRIQNIGQPISQNIPQQSVQDNRTYIQINAANLSDDEVKVAGKLLGMDQDEDVRKLEQFECIGKQATG